MVLNAFIRTSFYYLPIQTDHRRILEHKCTNNLHAPIYFELTVPRSIRLARCPLKTLEEIGKCGSEHG